MARYVVARSKAEATARMYALAGWPRQELGPGSKEKLSALEALGAVIGLELRSAASKVECGRLIAACVGVPWDSSCYSAGDTITLVGLNRLLDGVVLGRVIPGRAPDAQAVPWVEMSRISTGLSAAAASKEGPTMHVNDSELERTLAENMAALSCVSATPAEFDQKSASLSVDGINFGDGTWRECLLQVQGWLHLPEELDASSAPAFDAQLARVLGYQPALVAESVPQEELFRRLSERLERAVELREKFLEALEGADEGATTLEGATIEWANAWEEAQDEDEVEGSGPIHAEAKTWSIVQLVELASDNELNLSPSYQRADVWPTTDSQMLMESILRGIPLPSIIILQQNVGGRIGYEVVDGKQRLTSILRFMGRHPRAVAEVKKKALEWGVPDLLETFQKDYPAFKRLWKKHEQESLSASGERKSYFPFPLRGDVKPLSGELAPLRGRYYCEIRERQIGVLGEPRAVKHIFESQSSNYTLPIIVYKQVSTGQIHEVFSLYNKQGKHLNAEEIRNALYHELALMRGLLVTAGDSEDVENVAPFLASVWDDLKSTPAVLDQYGFGQAGYKRTKLLSWASSVLFLDDESESRSTSTANHINVLLDRVTGNSGHKLRDETTVREAMLLLDKALDAHALVPPDVWDSRFVNGLGRGKWQELQLVATIVALAAAYSVLGDQLDDTVEGCLASIEVESKKWRRPKKTQSKEQWLFIGSVVRELLNILAVSPAEADRTLRAAFGESGLAALLHLR